MVGSAIQRIIEHYSSWDYLIYYTLEGDRDSERSRLNRKIDEMQERFKARKLDETTVGLTAEGLLELRELLEEVFTDGDKLGIVSARKGKLKVQTLLE